MRGGERGWQGVGGGERGEKRGLDTDNNIAV